MSDDTLHAETQDNAAHAQARATRMEIEVQLVCESLEKEILPNLVIFVANDTHA